MEEQLKLTARKRALRLRARVIQAVRRFFIDREYLEVETPHLIPAPAPELHIDAVSAGNHFLHPSPELCMKRLLAAGYARLFQICRCFRAGERGAAHLPEFTMLEWYRAGIDYLGLMEECEEMVRFVARALDRDEVIEYQGGRIELRAPWDRITVRDAFLRFTSMSLKEVLDSDRFDELMVEKIEPHLGLARPTFIYDYPASFAPLARTRRDDPSCAERFELYVGGLELANAFSELTDSDEQARRFAGEEEGRRRLGKKAYPVPRRFLDALGYMPESAGIALGIDRLVMLFADETSIDRVVTFTPEEL